MNFLISGHASSAVSHTSWITWATAALVLFVFWFCGFFLFRVLYYYFDKWAKKTSTQFDDILVASSRYHIILWSFLIGAYVASRIAPLEPKTAVLVGHIIASLLLLSVTFLVANAASLFVKNYGHKTNFSLPLTSLTETLVRLIVIIVGILILLANLGISITPLLTALGVGSLAVALALQDTLSNLFAGFNILAAKQILPGNYIHLEGGQEGFVLDIGWRTARIQDLSNNIVIVPNVKLATTIVTNYNLPRKETSATVKLFVSYDSDLDRVEKITIDVARETLRDSSAGVPEFEPFIRYNAFGDSAIELTVIMQVKEFTDKFLLTHEFIKRIHRRYRQEGIEIPFPQRVIHAVPGKK